MSLSKNLKSFVRMHGSHQCFGVFFTMEEAADQKNVRDPREHKEEKNVRECADVDCASVRVRFVKPGSSSVRLVAQVVLRFVFVSKSSTKRSRIPDG